MNKLREGAGLPAIKFCPNATTQFIATDNIDAFNQAAKEYGVDKEYLFQASDLYEGQHKGLFGNVIICLHHLAVQVCALILSKPIKLDIILCNMFHCVTEKSCIRKVRDHN